MPVASYPFKVSLLIRGHRFSGGGFIAPSRVITLSHWIPSVGICVVLYICRVCISRQTASDLAKPLFHWFICHQRGGTNIIHRATAASNHIEAETLWSPICRQFSKSCFWIKKIRFQFRFRTDRTFSYVCFVKSNMICIMKLYIYVWNTMLCDNHTII